MSRVSSFLQNHALLVLLWAVLTAINVNKAYHIDDTFHLEAAMHLRQHPAQPMSGLINWEHEAMPMYTHNQPPLFFALIALVATVGGYAEPVLHLLLSIFVLITLWIFKKLVALLALPHPQVLLALFAFSPALIVNQNIMVDVPLLTFILSSLYFLLRAGHSQRATDYAWAALCLGIGLLIKYSALPLLSVLLLVPILRGKPRMAAMVLIPIGLLALWSAWNWAEFGGVHLLGRSAGGAEQSAAWPFVACLGAMSPYLIGWLHGALPKRAVFWGIVIGWGLFVLSAVLVAAGLIPEKFYARHLNDVFFGCGLLVIALLCGTAWKQWWPRWRAFLRSDACVLWLFVGAMSGFLVLFAPFIATRHILLILPLLLLLGADLLARAAAPLRRLTLATTAVLGLGLGISDWYYADFYRTMAAQITPPQDAPVWLAGHWGWQWYVRQWPDIQHYDRMRSVAHPGDYLIFPKNVSKQTLAKFHYTILKTYTQPATWATFFSVQDEAAMYNSYINKPPYTFSRNAIDTILVCRVDSFR